jgi:molybdate transport system substrate-binding protein
MRKLLITLVLLSLSSLVSAQQITVAAAADLNFALKDLRLRFEQKSSDKVTLSFGASGNLFAQIQNGAPFDLFFSADEEYPRKLADAGLGERASLRTYAIGRLVLWVPTSVGLDRAGPSSQMGDILLQPSIQHIAIANPKTAPYGRAAMAALERLGLKDKVAAKLVFGENVSQASQFVQSGNAQAGLIPLSLAMSPAMQGSGRYWEVPVDSYPELRQTVVIVSSSKRKAAAQAFLDYVTSAEGAAVLEQYGFRVPPAK